MSVEVTHAINIDEERGQREGLFFSYATTEGAVQALRTGVAQCALRPTFERGDHIIWVLVTGSRETAMNFARPYKKLGWTLVANANSVLRA